MKKIFVHVGMPKTGSTALQYFFYDNREGLEKQGVGFYLSTKRQRPRDLRANGDFINEAVVVGRNDLNWFEEEKQLFREYIRKYDSILLSEELMWLYSFDIRNYWKDAKAIIEELAGETVEICPIIYIRRQDEWAFSWWKESVRIAKPTNLYFSEFLSQIDDAGMLDYDHWISVMEAVFGKGNLILRIYEKNRNQSNSIYEDFLQLIGVRKDNAFVIKDSVINPSITMKAAYAIIMINKGYVKYRMETVDEVENLREASMIFTRNFPEDRELYPISPEARKRLADRFTDSNQRVSERYFNGKRLFSTEIRPYEICHPDLEEDMQNAKNIVKLARALEHNKRLKLHAAPKV